MAAEKLDDGDNHGVNGLKPLEALTAVFPELASPVEWSGVQGRAGHGVSAIIVSSLVTQTPTMCSKACPSHGATVDIFTELAASVVCNKALDIDTINVAAPTPATYSLDG